MNSATLTFTIHNESVLSITTEDGYTVEPAEDKAGNQLSIKTDKGKNYTATAQPCGIPGQAHKLFWSIQDESGKSLPLLVLHEVLQKPIITCRFVRVSLEQGKGNELSLGEIQEKGEPRVGIMGLSS